MRLRSYRHSVDIQTLSGSTTAASRGQSQKSYSTVQTVRGSIEQLRGEEALIARQIHPRATHQVEMYYSDRVNTRARLKFGDRVLNIHQVENRGERDRVLRLLCSEELCT